MDSLIKNEVDTAHQAIPIVKQEKDTIITIVHPVLSNVTDSLTKLGLDKYINDNSDPNSQLVIGGIIGFLSSLFILLITNQRESNRRKKDDIEKELEKKILKKENELAEIEKLKSIIVKLTYILPEQTKNSLYSNMNRYLAHGAGAANEQFLSNIAQQNLKEFRNTVSEIVSITDKFKTLVGENIMFNDMVHRVKDYNIYTIDDPNTNSKVLYPTRTWSEHTAGSEWHVMEIGYMNNGVEEMKNRVNKIYGYIEAFYHVYRRKDTFNIYDVVTTDILVMMESNQAHKDLFFPDTRK